jgi:hypothetical protein
MEQVDLSPRLAAIKSGLDEIARRNDLQPHQLQQQEQAERKRWFDVELRNRFQYLADTPLARERLATLCKMMTPHKAEGFDKIRIGCANDGGYVCLDDFKVEHIVSLGVGNDISWDLQAVTHAAVPVHRYDHTISERPETHHQFRFHHERVGKRADGNVTLRQIADVAGIASPASAILKINIEHAEWSVFDDTSPDELSAYSQIIGEFHGFDEVLDDNWYECATRVYSKITDQFKLVHAHGNNYGSQIVLGSRLFPRCAELTFANATRYSLSRTNETFPTNLDMPNNPNLPEIWFDYDL